jgi:hypothetical protein
MSFDNLMTEAAEIQRSAIQHQVATGMAEAGRAAGYAEKYLTQQAQSDFADIPGLFEPFSMMPDPAGYTGMVNSLAGAMHVLSAGQDTKDEIDGPIYPANPVMDKLTGSESYVENWTGKAAEDFKRNFIDPFRSVASNQFLLTSVLKSALEAHQELWRRARTDIDKIATDTIAALDHMDDCGSNDWSMAFTVLGAVVAVAAAPVTDGTSLIALAAVGSAASIASTAAGSGGGAPTRRFSGESAGAVISQMRQAITMLADDINAEEQKIARAMNNTHSIVLDSRSAFVSNRPLLAGANAKDITGPEFMGYPT